MTGLVNGAEDFSRVLSCSSGLFAWACALVCREPETSKTLNFDSKDLGTSKQKRGRF